eukprot:UN10001
MELLIRNTLLWLFVLISNLLNGLIWIVGTNIVEQQFIYLSIAYCFTAIDAAINTACILLGCPICWYYYNLCCKKKDNYTFCHKYCQLCCLRI